MRPSKPPPLKLTTFPPGVPTAQWMERGLGGMKCRPWYSAKIVRLNASYIVECRILNAVGKHPGVTLDRHYGFDSMDRAKRFKKAFMELGGVFYDAWNL